MTYLILGLLLFLGIHSVRIFAEDWRTARIASTGEKPWKRIVSIVSIVGFVLVVWGYGQARLDPVVLYSPPIWTRHLATLLTIPAFVLIVAAYVNGNRIKARIGHPMVAGVKLWAFAHLLANGMLADVILFGSFLVWAILSFIAGRRRDRVAGVVYPVGPVFKDVTAIVIGLAAWAVFAFWLHGPLIGVRPFA